MSPRSQFPGPMSAATAKASATAAPASELVVHKRFLLARRALLHRAMQPRKRHRRDNAQTRDAAAAEDNECQRDLVLHVREVLSPSAGACSLGLTTWRAARALGCYVALLGTAGDLDGKCLLELGAGTGLPTLVSALCGASNVYATDADVHALRNLRVNLKANLPGDLCDRVNTHTLDWRHYAVPDHRQELWVPGGAIDLILASDCLYDSSEWDMFLGCVCWLLDHTNSSDGLPAPARCVVSFRFRNPDHSLVSHLARWGLVASILDLPPSCGALLQEVDALGEASADDFSSHVCLFELTRGSGP